MKCDQAEVLYVCAYRKQGRGAVELKLVAVNESRQSLNPLKIKAIMVFFFGVVCVFALFMTMST